MENTEPGVTGEEGGRPKSPSGASIRRGGQRSLFGGRRSTDRWVGRTLIVLMVVMALFVVWTSVGQHTGEVERAKIVESLERQNKDLLCFADNTQAFELAVVDVLLVQRRNYPTDPDSQALLARLDEIRLLLRGAKRLCIDGVVIPVPSGTTSTTAVGPVGTR